MKPLASWIKDLGDRVDFMRSWLKHGHPPCYWLSGFFFPHGFMTGTLQTYARKHIKPIDLLTFKYRIMPSYDHTIYEKPPKDGIYVYRLFIEGARWNQNKRCLDEQAPGEMSSKMPVIHFLPSVTQEKGKVVMKKVTLSDDEDKNSSSENDANDEEDEQTKQQYSKKFKCPVYKTSVRAGTLSTTGQSTNYILAIDLPMPQIGMQEHWALRGTALISMLND